MNSKKESAAILAVLLGYLSITIAVGIQFGAIYGLYLFGIGNLITASRHIRNENGNGA